MPTRRKRPRLWLRPPRRDQLTGRIVRRATWIILDRGKHIATGCLESETVGADGCLQDYLRRKYAPARKERELETIDIADVLMVYVEDRGDRQSDPNKFRRRIGRLNEFWGGKKLADVTGASCRQYAQERGTTGARRELEDLRAAIGHHKKEGFHRGDVKVTLPERGLPRDRWLTRSEAARLLWACWRARESQGGVFTRKRPLRHLARFILIGLYTGSRAGAISAASPVRREGRSFVDLDRGIFYRLTIGRRATNKRQTPAPIPPRLLAHLRRWHRLGIAREHFVEFNGRPVKSVKTAFYSAVDKAGIEPASPHTLRHTAATWLMQNGAPLWQAAGFLSMSEKTLRDVYGHHHPDFMQEAVAAYGRKHIPANVVSLAEALADPLAKARRRRGVGT